mmetsp:Transcript_30378/g.88815  ORF Transcript_30378/g.88815 Transcript_30378/m.88815 type:complete len:205 (-) Transcript_30378:213-827(-)
MCRRRRRTGRLCRGVLMLMMMIVSDRTSTISGRSNGGCSCSIRDSRRLRRGASSSTGRCRCRCRCRTDQLPPRCQRCHISKVLTEMQFHHGIVPVHAKDVGQYGVQMRTAAGRLQGQVGDRHYGRHLPVLLADIVITGSPARRAGSSSRGKYIVGTCKGRHVHQVGRRSARVGRIFQILRQGRRRWRSDRSAHSSCWSVAASSY